MSGTSLERADLTPVRDAKKIELTAVVVPLAILLAGMLFSWFTSSITRQPIKNDAWFDSDATVVHDNITDIYGFHSHRTRKHPIYSLLFFPVVNILAASGFTKATAVRLIFSVSAGLWALLLYAALFRSLKRRLDAVVFALLALSTSSFLFWSWVTEIVLLSSVTVLLAILAFGMRGRFRLIGHFVASFATLGITVTNWSAELLGAAMSLPRRTAIIITLLAFGSVTVLALGEASLFRTNGFFLNVWRQAKEESEFVNHKSSGGIRARWRMFAIGSVVLPGVEYRIVEVYANTIYDRKLPMLSSQTVSGGRLWWVSGCLWLVLLSSGIAASIRHRSAFQIYLLLLAAFHFILHTFYGYETFLYSMHFIPILILLAAQSVEIHRRFALACAGLVLVLAFFNNWAVFQHAITMLRTMPF